MAPTLAYWGIRGLAQPLRFLLAYAGVDFEDKRYMSRESWGQDKETMGFEFPNLPYYVDGNLKITESSAITKHLARKHGLDGKTESEMIKLDIAAGVLTDIFKAFAMLCYNENFESLKDAYIKDIGTPLGKMNKMVAGKKFTIGDRVTYVDFTLFELIERMTYLVPGCLSGFSPLQDFHKRMSELPSMKKILNSDKFKKEKYNFNGPTAKFGAAKM